MEDVVTLPVRPRVMIVEDEAVVALDLEMRLERLGYEVVGVASRGRDAVNLARDALPDLVLMDICIEGAMDGIETARAIRGTRDVPTVFLTAYADDATLERAAAASPYGYLLKPFEERALAAAITIALRSHASVSRARALAAALRASSVGVAVAEVRGDSTCTRYVNHAFVHLMGRAVHDINGGEPLRRGATTDDALLAVLDAWERRSHADRVVYQQRGDGTWGWVSLCAAPIRNDEGLLSHMLLWCKDITAQRALEHALADAQRLDDVGRMAAGVAHDLNNVLAAVVGFTESALADPDPEARGLDLREVIEAALRGRALARKLLDFARKREATPGANCDLAHVISGLHAMLTYMAGERVRVHVRLEAQRLPVGLDSTSVAQVLLNLVANARDAMADGGEVEVLVRDEPPAEGHPRRACVEVRDGGVGIDEETLTRIFDPLFTTKPRGRGTGLGLTTVRTLVDGAGGSITARSAPGRGSTFTVLLPLVERAHPQQPEHEPPRAGRAVPPTAVSTG